MVQRARLDEIASFDDNMAPSGIQVGPINPPTRLKGHQAPLIDAPKCKRCGVQFAVDPGGVARCSPGCVVTRKTDRPTPAEYARLRAEYDRLADTERPVDIARRLGVDIATIKRWRRKQARPPRPLGNRSQSTVSRQASHPPVFKDQSRVIRAMQMYVAGKTLNEICESCSCDEVTIYRWRKRLGIPGRPPGNYSRCSKSDK